MIMRKWLYDRPWIWIVLLLAAMVGSGFAVVVIAQLNRPEIVKEERLIQNMGPTQWLVENPRTVRGRVV